MSRIFTKMTISLVAVCALASIASAQSFTIDLGVGATGTEVVALQTALIAQGYDIPAISSGVVSKGTFGSQTRNAVKKYQTSKGLPSTGFVGPLTRGALNGTASVASAPASAVCPAGFTCVPVAGAPVTTATPGSITTTGVAGTLAVSLQGSPSGASLDKGETEDVVRYKLQAAASDEQVTSVSLDFDTRLWLMAGSVTIKDDSGAVVAQKTGLSASDFTELTVGTSYRLYVPVNYVIPRAQSRYFTVSVTMLPISDRSAATVTISQFQVRAVDGTGVSSTQTETADRTFSYTGGNSSQIVITLNDQAPPNMLVPISGSSDTENVVLGVANIRSQNKDGVMRKVSMYVSTNGLAPSSIFNDIKIVSGNLAYSADSIANGNAYELTVFSNMAIPLPKDTNVPVAIVARVKPNTNNAINGAAASTTIVASGTAGGTSNNPVVEDASANTIDINDANIATSDITFSESDANLFKVAPRVTLGAPIINSNTTVAQPVTFEYTLTAGANTLYVSAVPASALATTSTGYGSAANASSTITSVTATPSDMSGDSSGSYFVIPAGGSRSFKWTGVMRYDPPRGSVLRTLKITGIRYGTSSSNLTAETVVYYDYDSLKAETVL